MMRDLFAHAVQILIAGLGGLAFHSLGIPAAWLSGAALAVILWGLTGWAVRMPRALTDLAMLVSGATMGAAVTPAALDAIARYPASLALLVVAVLMISAGSAYALIRLSGWRKDDAVLASVPGALSTVLAVAADRNAAVGQVAIVQNMRLFALIALLPSAIVMSGSVTDSGVLLGEGLPIGSPTSLCIVLLGGLAVGTILARLRIAAPILLGATLVSTVGHATDFVTGVIPPVIATGGLILIGMFVAERFRDLDPKTIRPTLLAGLTSFVIGMAIASVFAVLAAWVSGVTFADSLVAFAPGGLEAMTVLALVLGLDPLYVGVHHFVRFIGIALTIPFVIAWLQRNDPPGSNPDVVDKSALKP
ncbi:AbrB family transcriptional regulator [Microvirga antarctica]|uniref:AbrB family transcriptional regulator n=1 Tax=Microvirga antarctica TaxID=2819233 RepID=UPI001FEC891B|nr:AbrB family transcriptional regulator [Microvirga antarctica]